MNGQNGRNRIIRERERERRQVQTPPSNPIRNDYGWLWQIFGRLLFIVFSILAIWHEIYRRSGKLGEKNTCRLIKNFLKNHYQEKDYLLVSNLILKKPYWNCEIDILLLTRKWIYVIEVKDWQIGMLRGNFNDEYFELSWKVRRTTKGAFSFLAE
jgi:hypothetical protein